MRERTRDGGRGVVSVLHSRSPSTGSLRVRAAAASGRGAGGHPHSPAYPAAAGTDVAAVRTAILWERNQRLARSSINAAAAEGEVGAGAGAGLGCRNLCLLRRGRRGGEGLSEARRRGKAGARPGRRRGQAGSHGEAKAEARGGWGPSLKRIRGGDRDESGMVRAEARPSWGSRPTWGPRRGGRGGLDCESRPGGGGDRGRS